MESIKSLDEIADRVKGKKKRLAVAGGNAPSVIGSIARASREKIIEPVLIGKKNEIIALAEEYGIDGSGFDIIDEADPRMTAVKAVDLVKKGAADFIMKGIINTADYMHAILDKKNGLVNRNSLLTHITVIEVPTYHKLLIVSDVAIIVAPDLAQKISMLRFCIDIAKALGIDRPKASIISCVEKPSFKIDSTIDANIIKKLAQKAKISGGIVDGPLAIDLAISKRCAETKKFTSEVAGDSDILIFPNICTANVFFKTLTILAKARIAAIVVGAEVPCVLTSRADTEESKYVSIALGALTS
jgi:phosphate butyryltransferase